MALSTHSLPDTNANSDDNLVEFTTKIIRKTEDFKSFIYTDSKGIPTIGYGNALVVTDPNGVYDVLPSNDLADIFDGVSHSLTPADIELLQDAAAYLNGVKDEETGIVTDEFGAVLSNPFNSSINVTNWNITASDADEMLENTLSSEAGNSATQAVDYIKGLKNVLGQFTNGSDVWDFYKDSPEGAALLSLWYNGQSKLISSSGNLTQALKDKNRVAAWWEIRYGSNGDKLPGLAKRRYWESAIFGLYNDPENVTDVEAQEIIDFLLAPSHYSTIAGKGAGDELEIPSGSVNA